MPPIKELHYFSRSVSPLPKYLPSSNPWHACRIWERPVRQWWRHLLTETKLSFHRCGLSRRGLRELAWHRKFFFGFPKDLAWYRSLFAPAAGRFCGEITPAYSLLEETTIGEIRRELPELRIVFRMRDPIDRALSHLALTVKEGHMNRHANAQQLLEFLTSAPVQQRGDYRGILARWRKHYPADQIFVGWYEDVAKNPVTAYHDVLNFLQLPRLENDPVEPMSERYNHFARVETSEAVVREVARQMRPQIAALADQFGHHALQWLAHCDDLLSA